MTTETANRVANVILAAGAAAAAWVVLRDPARRRAAFKLLGGLAAGPLPAFLGRELRQAWEESGRRSMMTR